MAFVIFGTRDGQEIPTGDVATGIEKVWRVEEVGRIRAKLKFHPLQQLKRAEQAEIEIHRTWPSQAISANVAVPDVRHGHEHTWVVEWISRTNSAQLVCRPDLVRCLRLIHSVQRSAGSR